MAHLVRPSEAYKESYLQALQEFHAEGRRLYLNYVQLSTDFRTFVSDMLSKNDPAKLMPGRVLETVYWLVDGDTYIGRVSVRHYLTDYNREVGGHIGYDIRPSKRRQGYGTEILRLALVEAGEIGLTRVLLTCDFDNIASRKIIEANGGLLEGEVVVEEQETPVRRYWISLKV